MNKIELFKINAKQCNNNLFHGENSSILNLI